MPSLLFLTTKNKFSGISIITKEQMINCSVNWIGSLKLAID